MGELIIKEHNFIRAKNKIQAYSSSVPTDVRLQRVAERGGLFRLGDHRVTGEEMNKFASDVQNALIGINNRTKSIISEFKEVYNAFEALDADYITGIVAAVKSAQRASEEAKVAQNDTLKTIDAIRATFAKFKEFKTTVNNELNILKAQCGITLEHVPMHFVDIDTLWNEFHSQLNDYSSFHDDTLSRSSAIEAAIGNVKDHIESIQTGLKSLSDDSTTSFSLIHSSIDLLNQYKCKLESYAHLRDIDQMWVSQEQSKSDYEHFRQDFEHASETLTNSINKVSGDLSTNNQTLTSKLAQVDVELLNLKNNLSSLQEYRAELMSYAHLSDVDTIWDNVQTNTNDLKSLHEQFKQHNTSVSESLAQIQESLASHSCRLSEIEFSVAALKEYVDRQYVLFSTRLRTTHIIAASAVILSIAIIALNILGVI